MNFKPMQSWRMRNGQLATIKTSNCLGIVVDIEGVSGICALDSNGRVFVGNQKSDYDLLEQVRRIYIAGPMTGLPQLNFPAFHAEAAKYRAKGCFVVNPAEINGDPKMKWEDAMRADIPLLLTCDTIAVLAGYTLSRGARLELEIAHALGMEVIWPKE
jgi:hypothetical protein